VRGLRVERTETKEVRYKGEQFAAVLTGNEVVLENWAGKTVIRLTAREAHEVQALLSLAIGEVERDD